MTIQDEFVKIWLSIIQSVAILNVHNFVVYHLIPLDYLVIMPPKAIKFLVKTIMDVVFLIKPRISVDCIDFGFSVFFLRIESEIQNEF